MSSDVKRVAGLFDAARGEHPLLSKEMRLIELVNHGGAETDQARVLIVALLRYGREQLGIDHGADLAFDVVEHAVGIDGAIALAEDDVAFHVDFQRLVVLLRGAAGGRRWY